MKILREGGVEGGGGGGTTTSGAAHSEVAPTSTVASPGYKFEFQNPEIRENFSKMFPGMKDVESLAKTAIEQQRLIGQKGVILPTKPEDFTSWAQTNLKTPKDGKGYNFDALKIPDGVPADKAALGLFAETFAKAGMTQRQADICAEAFYGLAGQEVAQSATQKNEMAAKSRNTLEKEWGGDFEKNLNGANMALTTLGNPELVDLIGKSDLRNDVNFLKFLHNAAGLMKEDSARGGMSPNGFAAGPQQAQQEIDMLYANKDFMRQYTNSNDPGYKAAQQKMHTLFEIKNGERGRQTRN